MVSDLALHHVQRTTSSNFMTVIYEFPVDAETTLQHYDIYFTNEELTQDQKI